MPHQPERFLQRVAVLLEDLVAHRPASRELLVDGGELTEIEAKILEHIEALHRQRVASSEREDSRERELVAPLIEYMIDIAGGRLRLSWQDVEKAADTSLARSRAMAALLNLDEELRFSEQQQQLARQEQVALNERLAAQNADLLEQREEMAALIESLSTLTLEISPGVLLAPLVGHYDAERTAHVTAHILKTIAAREIHRVVLDFTGVPRVDDDSARRFLELSQGIALLGASVTAAGIQPHVAVAMTGSGIDLTGMEVATGVDKALAPYLPSARRRS